MKLAPRRRTGTDAKRLDAVRVQLPNTDYSLVRARQYRRFCCRTMLKVAVSAIAMTAITPA
jgi:hypothetical protein